jgi:hypothetical protein
MRSVAILGMSGPSNLKANELSPGVELWGMNMCHTFLTRRAQRWFQMHHRMHAYRFKGDVTGHFGRPKSHEDWLQSCGIPVYMQEEDPAIPTSYRYPIERVVDHVGGYLTSTVALMIALALADGVEELTLLGIYMNTGPEYTDQRPCIEYLLGFARAQGVKVVLPLDCYLTKAPLYAYSEFREPMSTLELESVEVVA